MKNKPKKKRKKKQDSTLIGLFVGKSEEKLKKTDVSLVS
jgi:hypothetical protein